MVVFSGSLFVIQMNTLSSRVASVVAFDMIFFIINIMFSPIIIPYNSNLKVYTRPENDNENSNINNIDIDDKGVVFHKKKFDLNIYGNNG